jgi:hypothetical protein
MPNSIFVEILMTLRTDRAHLKDINIEKLAGVGLANLFLVKWAKLKQELWKSGRSSFVINLTLDLVHAVLVCK